MATPPSDADEELPGARGTLELVGLVIAPTTLLTALAFYFGWTFTNARAEYFGLDPSALGFSTQDYVLRSTDALFVPLGAVVVLALGAVALHAVATRRLADPANHARLRSIARATIVVGALLFALGVLAIIAPSLSPYYLFVSAAPGIGIALLAYALRLLHRIDRAGGTRSRAGLTAHNSTAAIGLLAVLIVLSGFWTISRYADRLGTSRAERTAARLADRPGVTVFSPKRLAIDLKGVTERELEAEGSAYGYAYSGLRLLLRSADKYFLLPDGWSRARGTVVVLADDPASRFEFTPGRLRATAESSRVQSTVLARSPLSFGEVRVGRTSRQTLRVDAEDKPLTIRGFSVSGDAKDFRIALGRCRIGATVRAGASCTVRVTFAPTARGDSDADLTIETTPASEQGGFLSGTGT